MAGSTIARVKKVTAEVLKKKVSAVSDTARFVEDLHAESIQAVELVAGLEEEFGIEIDERAAMKVKSVDTAVAFIDKLLAKQK